MKVYEINEAGLSINMTPHNLHCTVIKMKEHRDNYSKKQNKQIDISNEAITIYSIMVLMLFYNKLFIFVKWFY